MADINFKKLYTLLKADEKQVRKIIRKELEANGYDVVIDKDFIYAEGSIPVMLIAHYDTVPNQPKYVANKDGVLSAKHGLGADDRAGIYAILDIIVRHHCSVLFTGGEESGGIGAKAFTKSGIIASNVNYCIQLDRRGENDAVFYDCDNAEFEEFITSHEWKTAIGSFTDICIVAPHLGVSAVNLSVGYTHEHTYSETLDTKVLSRTIDRVPELLYGDKFEYIESEYSKYYGWDYSSTYSEIGWVMWVGENGEYQYEETYGDTELESIGYFLIEHPDLRFNDIVDYGFGDPLEYFDDTQK